MTTISSRAAALCLALFSVACGGGGGGGGTPTTPPTPTPTTSSFAGRATAASANSCGGDLHAVDAAAGPISVLLVATTDNVGLSAQLCSDNVASADCTLSRRPIAVGETLTAERRGGRNQILSLLTANCGGGGPQPGGPIDYTVRVTFLH